MTFKVGDIIGARGDEHWRAEIVGVNPTKWKCLVTSYGLPYEYKMEFTSEISDAYLIERLDKEPEMIVPDYLFQREDDI